MSQKDNDNDSDSIECDNWKQVSNNENSIFLMKPWIKIIINQFVCRTKNTPYKPDVDDVVVIFYPGILNSLDG